MEDAAFFFHLEPKETILEILESLINSKAHLADREMDAFRNLEPYLGLSKKT